MYRIRTFIAFILLISQLTSGAGFSAFAEDEMILHDVHELPSYYLEKNIPFEDTRSFVSLIEERHEYIVAGKKEQQESKEVSYTGRLSGSDLPTKEIKIDKRAKITDTVIDAGKKTITSQIPDGTIIRAKNGDEIRVTEFGLHETTMTSKEKAKAKWEKKIRKRVKKGSETDTTIPAETLLPPTFEFGIPGTHLIFSKPVAVTIDTPNMTDGVGVEILVLHEGDTEYNTSGLSVNPLSECNPDGASTDSGNIATVKGGKATFYTCGASSYTFNPTGGVAGSNDLRLVIGDCGQFQLYYNGTANMWTGNPPTTGCNNTLDSWIALRIGNTTYGSDWTAWSSNGTVGSQVGNTYSGTTTLQRTVGGRNYQLILNWVYTAPNKYFTINWRVIIPTGNPAATNVRFYIGNDSMVGGGDPNDVGYSGSAPTRTFGVYDSVLNQLSAIRYISGATWTAGEVGPLATVKGRITNGTNFANTITASTDQGFGINWNLGNVAGTYSGTLEWRVTPFVSTNVPDLISGIGQPTPGLTVGQTSSLPVTATNVGNTGSTGLHTLTIGIPNNILGPSTSFVNNGWSCGAQVGTGVTCTKTTVLNPLVDDTVTIPVIPQLAASGQTLRFTALITNATDSNNTNNSSYVDLQVTVAPPPADTVAPTITNSSIASGTLIPHGRFTLALSYSDTGSNINPSTVTGSLFSWNTGTLAWNATNLAPTYMSITGTTSTTTGTFLINNLPFGKYRFDFTVRDNQGNTANRSFTYFVDQIEWTVSSDTYDIGDIMGNVTKFGTGELTITVRTVGAGFLLTTSPNTNILNPGGTAMNYWDGSFGVGIDQWNGTAYLGTISSYASGYTLGNVTKNINQNGLRATYVYRIKYGGNFPTSQETGNYIGTVRFGLTLNY